MRRTRLPRVEIASRQARLVLQLDSEGELMAMLRERERERDRRAEQRRRAMLARFGGRPIR